MNKVILVFGMLALGLVAFFGLYLFLKGVRNVQMAAASAKWPTTSGEVVSSETTRDASPDRRKSPSTVTFDTRTVVRYTVNGREYTTDQRHFGQTLGSSDKSDAALQRLRYPAGQSVTVSYNPANPSIGVIKPGVHAEAFWLPGAGLAFLLPTALCMILLPGMIRSFTTDDKAFADYVQRAIEEGRRNPNMVPRGMPPPPRQGGDAIMPVAGAAFGAVLCGLGLLALTAGLQRVWHGVASQNWPTVSGVVVSAVKGGGEDGEDAPDDTTDPGFLSRVVYEYSVAGTKHFNNVRQFAQVEGGSREEAEKIAMRYRQGAKVTVSYFPTDPDIAVLEPGNSKAALWLPGIGVVLILFSLATFIWVVPALGKP